MADLQDIVDDLETEIRRPISVEDRRWRLLAHSAQPDETDAVRRQSILSRETAPNVTAWLDGLGLQRARELVDVPANEALGMSRRGCLPIRHGDVLLGFLWVIVGDRPLSDDERAALARGAGEVSDNLWGRRREADERRARTQSLLRELLDGGDVATELATTLRWPATGAYAVVVSSGGEDMAERLRRRRGAADFAWTADGDRLVILARDPERGAGGPAAAAAARGAGASSPVGGLAAALAAAGAAGGVSALFAQLDGTRAALHQAEIAALVARAQPELGPVAAWNALGSWALVAGLWSDAGRPAPPLAILQLAAHKRGDQLIEALEALLEAGGDVAATARALHLHRASLYRRLERIEEITGLDLERGDDRLLAHLGLRVYRLHATAVARSAH